VKVEIKHNGMLMIEPETETEAFALKHWWKTFNATVRFEPAEPGSEAVGIGITPMFLDIKDSQ
jgi:hypothetical protein